MRRYRVPVKLTTTRGARNKAVIAYMLRRRDPETGDARGAPYPEPGAQVYDFEAPTHAAAARHLAEVVLPGDPRPIMSRTNVKLFVVE